VNQFARHFLALFGAAHTFFGAFAAMFHVVFAAFFGAATANLRAMPTDVRRLFRTAGHQFRAHRANQCAIQIQFDAAREFLDHVFFQTGAGAMFALHRAVIAGIDAALIFFVGHNFLREFSTLKLSSNKFQGKEHKTCLTIQAFSHKNRTSFRAWTSE
jgi:hypothetical protein